MRQCDKCGAVNQDNADFCSLCMTPFTGNSDANAEKSGSPPLDLENKEPVFSGRPPIVS